MPLGALSSPAALVSEFALLGLFGVRDHRPRPVRRRHAARLQRRAESTRGSLLRLSQASAALL